MTAIYILLGVEVAIIAFLLWQVYRLEEKFADLADVSDDILDDLGVEYKFINHIVEKVNSDLRDLISHLGLEFVDTPAKRELVEKGDTVE